MDGWMDGWIKPLLAGYDNVIGTMGLKPSHRCYYNLDSFMS